MHVLFLSLFSSCPYVVVVVRTNVQTVLRDDTQRVQEQRIEIDVPSILPIPLPDLLSSSGSFLSLSFHSVRSQVRNRIESEEQRIGIRDHLLSHRSLDPLTSLSFHSLQSVFRLYFVICFPLTGFRTKTTNGTQKFGPVILQMRIVF